MGELSVLLDLSPITSDPKLRSGLARYSYDLVKGITNKKIEVGINASGSVWSTLEVKQVSIDENWEYVGKLPPDYLQNSLLQRIYNLVRSTVSKESGKKYDLYHSTYARIRKDVRKHFHNRHILTVHDLTPLKFTKDYFHPNQKAITSRIINSIKPGDHIIAVSENTRQDLIDYRKLDPSTVHTVYNGYDEMRFFPWKDQQSAKAILGKYGLGDYPYFLTVSAMGPHKNLKTFLDAGLLLVNENPQFEFKLVIGGKRNAWVEDLLKKYPPHFINQRVVITEFIPDEDLSVWYSNCLGFVFPSIYEGFGLPMLEAMACGAPIIYANNSSLKEIGQGVGFACETMEAPDYAMAMKTLLDDEQLVKAEQVKSLKRAGDFNMENCIQNTINVYQKVIDG